MLQLRSWIVPALVLAVASAAPRAESDPEAETEAAYGYGIGSVYGRPGFHHKYTNPYYKSLPTHHNHHTYSTTAYSGTHHNTYRHHKFGGHGYNKFPMTLRRGKYNPGSHYNPYPTVQPHKPHHVGHLPAKPKPLPHPTEPHRPHPVSPLPHPARPQPLPHPSKPHPVNPVRPFPAVTPAPPPTFPNPPVPVQPGHPQPEPFPVNPPFPQPPPPTLPENPEEELPEIDIDLPDGGQDITDLPIEVVQIPETAPMLMPPGFFEIRKVTNVPQQPSLKTLLTDQREFDRSLFAFPFEENEIPTDLAPNRGVPDPNLPTIDIPRLVPKAPKVQFDQGDFFEPKIAEETPTAPPRNPPRAFPRRPTTTARPTSVFSTPNPTSFSTLRPRVPTRPDLRSFDQGDFFDPKVAEDTSARNPSRAFPRRPTTTAPPTSVFSTPRAFPNANPTTPRPVPNVSVHSRGTPAPTTGFQDAPRIRNRQRSRPPLSFRARGQRPVLDLPVDPEPVSNAGVSSPNNIPFPQRPFRNRPDFDPRSNEVNPSEDALRPLFPRDQRPRQQRPVVDLPVDPRQVGNEAVSSQDDFPVTFPEPDIPLGPQASQPRPLGPQGTIPRALGPQGSPPRALGPQGSPGPQDRPPIGPVQAAGRPIAAFASAPVPASNQVLPSKESIPSLKKIPSFPAVPSLEATTPADNTQLLARALSGILIPDPEIPENSAENPLFQTVDLQ